VSADQEGEQMSDLENGMLVQHASLGLGKVVALDAKAVHVFFATSDTRFATKLRLPMSLPFLSPAATSNAWLAALSSFALDAKTGRYGLGGGWLSHGDAVARFLEQYPQGFADPAYLGDGASRKERIARWRQAHELFEETLGRGEGERLLAAGDVAGLSARASKIERHVRPLHKDAEKEAFEAGLENVDAARGFFTALFGVLADAPGEARFEALAAAVATLVPGASEESRWSIATLLPFVAQPERHALLRPRTACEIAQRLAVVFPYASEPNWTTYAALLDAAGTLLGKLQPLGARDQMDVESFMHVTMAKHSRPRTEEPRAAGRRTSKKAESLS
jgi:hypothetical protein